MYTHDVLMLNCRLFFSLGCIALFLFLNKFLNFRCVHTRWHQTTVLHFASLNHTLDLSLDVTICEILLLEEELGILAPQRRVIQSCLCFIALSMPILALVRIQSCARLTPFLLARRLDYG